uniref:Uncharacterized protein n=1 Tax=Rhizophora mucronata TaxID=61149 RepID=A0A2P2P7F1_RHIMU
MKILIRLTYFLHCYGYLFPAFSLLNDSLSMKSKFMVCLSFVNLFPGYRDIDLNEFLSFITE